MNHKTLLKHHANQFYNLTSIIKHTLLGLFLLLYTIIAMPENLSFNTQEIQLMIDKRQTTALDLAISEFKARGYEPKNYNMVLKTGLGSDEKEYDIVGFFIPNENPNLRGGGGQEFQVYIDPQEKKVIDFHSYLAR